MPTSSLPCLTVPPLSSPLRQYLHGQKLLNQIQNRIHVTESKHCHMQAKIKFTEELIQKKQQIKCMRAMRETQIQNLRKHREGELQQLKKRNTSKKQQHSCNMSRLSQQQNQQLERFKYESHRLKSQHNRIIELNKQKYLSLKRVKRDQIWNDLQKSRTYLENFHQNRISKIVEKDRQYLQELKSKTKNKDSYQKSCEKLEQLEQSIESSKENFNQKHLKLHKIPQKQPKARPSLKMDHPLIQRINKMLTKYAKFN